MPGVDRFGSTTSCAKVSAFGAAPVRVVPPTSLRGRPPGPCPILSRGLPVTFTNSLKVSVTRIVSPLTVQVSSSPASDNTATQISDGGRPPLSLLARIFEVVACQSTDVGRVVIQSRMLELRNFPERSTRIRSCRRSHRQRVPKHRDALCRDVRCRHRLGELQHLREARHSRCPPNARLRPSEPSSICTRGVPVTLATLLKVSSDLDHVAGTVRGVASSIRRDFHLRHTASHPSDVVQAYLSCAPVALVI